MKRPYSFSKKKHEHTKKNRSILFGKARLNPACSNCNCWWYDEEQKVLCACTWYVESTYCFFLKEPFWKRTCQLLWLHTHHYIMNLFYIKQLLNMLIHFGHHEPCLKTKGLPITSAMNLSWCVLEYLASSPYKNTGIADPLPGCLVAQSDTEHQCLQ